MAVVFGLGDLTFDGMYNMTGHFGTAWLRLPVKSEGDQRLEQTSMSKPTCDVCTALCMCRFEARMLNVTLVPLIMIDAAAEHCEPDTGTVRQCKVFILVAGSATD